MDPATDTNSRTCVLSAKVLGAPWTRRAVKMASQSRQKHLIYLT
jgi:hypothetical protein